MKGDNIVLVDGLELRDARNFVLHYTDEASVRRGVARLARAYGWAVVQEEVVVPGWGRIDLVLQDQSTNSIPLLVELKLDLTKRAHIRRAFQQSDGYGRWWEKTTGGPSLPILSSCTGDAPAIKDIGDAYPAVRYLGVHILMHRLRTMSTAPALKRVDRARERLLDLQQQVALHQMAVDNLGRAIAEDEFLSAARERDEQAIIDLVGF